VSNAVQKLRTIRTELRQIFLEREEVVDGVLAALVAGEHVLLAGPPGTAKSMLAEEVCRRIEGGVYFSWLLTKFTTPEEVFGAISLAGLERDEYRRVTTGKLPEAHVAFLDEVFKASSAILNALLGILNERRFHNAGRAETVPLRTLVGATNEVPEEEELAALYDRFLVRFVVDYLQEDFRFLKMLTLEEPTRRTTLTLGELEGLAAEAGQVRVPDGFLHDLAALRRDLGGRGVIASDRRYRGSLRVLKAHALLHGRGTLGAEDAALLGHILWTDPAEIPEVQAAIAAITQGHSSEAQRLVFQAREMLSYVRRDWPDEEAATRAAVEAHKKVADLLRRAESLRARVGERGLDLEPVEAAVRELEEIRSAILADGLGAQRQ
jgi:MoxR-like ATPase